MSDDFRESAAELFERAERKASDAATDAPTDAPTDALAEAGESREVPREIAQLPDGRFVWKIGKVDEFAELHHKQGDNILGWEQDCGLAAIESVLRQFGRTEVTESSVVLHAWRRQLCDIKDPAKGEDPADSGGTYYFQQAEILEGMGLAAHEERGRTLDDLARYVEEGRGVIIEVDAGYLWDDSDFIAKDGGYNHAVAVTGVARNLVTGEVEGIYLNDSGKADGAGVFVDKASMDKVWKRPPADLVVTDSSRLGGNAVPPVSTER